MRNEYEIGQRRIRRGALVALLALALAGLTGAVGADAAGTFSAAAATPSYDTASLQLTASGSYRTARRHTQLRVTVCLDHKVGARFFQVRCATSTGAGKFVTGPVAVPGCVKGNWRTTATGEALNRKGQWIHRASAKSPPFRC
jgi:hypothetical protein